jgi:hypothetical protein
LVSRTGRVLVDRRTGWVAASSLLKPEGWPPHASRRPTCHTRLFLTARFIDRMTCAGRGIQAQLFRPNLSWTLSDGGYIFKRVTTRHARLGTKEPRERRGTKSMIARKSNGNGWPFSCIRRRGIALLPAVDAGRADRSDQQPRRGRTSCSNASLPSG